MGGTQYLFQNISERLFVNYNDDVTVYTTDSYFGPQRKQYKKIKENKSVIHGVKVVRFSYYKFYFKFLDKLFQIFNRFNITIPQKLIQIRIGPISPKLKKALYNNEFDIVCASASDYNYMLYPLFRHKGLKPKPFVFMGALHLAENAKDDSILKQKMKSIEASEYYIANTLFEKKRLTEYGIPAKNIKVIGCGINLPDYENASVIALKKQLNINNDLVIGYFGRHDRIKGIETTLFAFETLAKQNSHLSLIIAGASSAYTKEIKNIISTFNQPIQDKCFVLENVSEKDKVAIMHEFDIFVCPSLKESFGIVFLEAWACKKPVIGTDIGALRSVISHGIDGFLIKPNNTDELISYCTTLIRNNALRKDMGEKGYEKVKQNFTLDIIADKYRTIYKSAIAKYLNHEEVNCYDTNVLVR